MEVIRISSFDGQSVWLDSATELFEVGNFLGGGAAGNVYECEHMRTHERFALKILNPLGYKILSPSLLRRCNVVLKGKVFSDNEKSGESHLKKEHLWWVVNGTTKQYLACYYSEKQAALRELSLNQCIELWGTEGNIDDELDVVSLRNNIVPNYPPKFVEFLRKRNKIFREIRNMRKISNHRNVIRLEGVLELIQDSKSTLFLVMELANGGELFDRIKIDCGTREETARVYFCQLLQGVKHCHDQGVCHRDLKPENLLLQDDGANGTILKIADFGFSAHFNQINESDNGGGNNGGIGWNNERLPAPPPSPFSNNLPPKEEPLRVLKSIVGSPFYVAPEVMQSSGYDGTKVDVWSLGVILYAMLAGNLPFGQDLTTCKRFKHFCKWVKEQSAKGVKFWDDSTIEYPQWLFPAKFSAAAKGLIVAMLHPDPAQRITVEEAMRHPLCRLNIPQTQSTNNNNNSNNNTQPSLTENRFSVALAQSNSGSAVHDQTAMDIANNDVSMKESQTNSRNNSHASDYDDEVAMFKMEEDEDTAEEKSEKNYSTPPPADKQKHDNNEQQTGKSDSNYNHHSSGSHSGRSSSSGLKPLPMAPPSYLSNQMPVRDLIVNSPEECDDEDSHSPHASQSTPHANNQIIGGFGGPVQTSQLYRQDSTGSDSRMLPSFNDRVKRSTRFITSVPAEQVLSKIEEILHDVCRNRIETPVGYISKVDLNWEHFRLEVYGHDIQAPPICALQLYQIPSNLTGVAYSPNDYIYSPSQSYSSWMLTQSQQPPQLMVEFIRGQLEIFAFKRFYHGFVCVFPNWLRKIMP